MQVCTRRFPLLCAAALVAAALPAQIKPGNSITAVTRAAGVGEMHDIDHQAGTATALTLSATLAAEVPNCVEMVNGILGYVGTNPVAPATGNVYRITVASGAVTEALLNTTPTAGGNVAQLALVGSTIYFTTQDASLADPIGILQSVPTAGGPVTAELKLASVTGAVGLANAVAAIGTTVYVATFDSGTVATNTGSLIAYDTVSKTGKLVMSLPQGKFISGTSTFNTGIVHARVHPTMKGTLILQGVYGDWLVVDVLTPKIVSHGYAGFVTSTSNLTNLVNSFDVDHATGDYIVGSRDDHVERAVSDHSAEKIIKLGATSSSVGGLSHVQAPKGLITSTGPGCAGSGGYTLTDVSYGLTTAGNSGFAFGVHSGYGGNPVALSFGTADPNLDLGFVPMPGCFLHINFVPAVTLNATLSGTGDGMGKAKFPVAIPATAVGAKLYWQWFELQVGGTKSNPVGIVVSNGRYTQVQ